MYERGEVGGIAFLQDATPPGVKLVGALVPGLHVHWDSAPLRRKLKPINPELDSPQVCST